MPIDRSEGGDELVRIACEPGPERLDDGVLGENYVEVLTSDNLDDLLNVRHMDDLNAARQEIEAGNARAVVYVPEGFSDALISTSSDNEPASASVEVYTDPAANISPFIIQSIVEQITAGANTMLLEEFIVYAKGHPGVWFARCIDIARWWL
ncbi:MAG: hypothetical protein IH935_00595, partial [Acidobacteria bacterium]|nr:hypothetical protein [Acidobacteriota bacterium]